MPNTIGNHAVATFTSPSNGDSLDANIVKGNDNTLRSAYVDHDSDPGIHLQSSDLASRPAAGTAGRKWMTTDAGDVRVWYDNGSSWEEVDYVRVGGSASFIDLTVTGNLDVQGNTTIGNASADTVTVNAQVASSLVPSTTNTRDLGSTSNRFRDLWLAGNATTANLSVTGTQASFRSVTYTMPATQGGANTALTNDGAGNLTWAASSVVSTGSDLYLRSTFR